MGLQQFKPRELPSFQRRGGCAVKKMLPFLKRRRRGGKSSGISRAEHARYERAPARHNSGTAAEAMLWKHLQRRQILGKKFRRQEGIGPYIVDFYCPECRVIVELDGAPHFEADKQEYDAERTNYLEELGMKVIRFENRALYEDTEWVLETIKQELRGRERR